MDTEWQILQADEGCVRNLCRNLKIPLLLAQVLFNRGITSSEEAYRFLYPRLAYLHNPFTFKDMEKAVKRVYQAILRQEQVVIYGDYDVDGVTGTAILYLFLSPLLSRIDCYIPHRIREGYGLNPEAIKKIAALGTSLLITTDCGSSDVEEIKLARSLGMDVIVIDHHEVPKDIPPVYALINPKRPDCAFPFKDLAGVGVTFNFLIALRQFLTRHNFWSQDQVPNLKEYLDLVALGTVADVVPLRDENRIFVKYGLELLSSGNEIDRRPGLKSLKKISGLNGQVSVQDIAFRLGPRINAAGRMSAPQMALRLLITKDCQEADYLAQELNELNKKRQRVEEQILREAEQIFKQTGKGVLASKDWHPGVIGIVASRLTETFKRPFLLISLNEELGRGSGRSIEGCDLYAMLSECQNYLLGYGGHKMAAGFTISPEDLEAFVNQFEEVVKEVFIDRAQKQDKCRLTIDAEVKLAELSSCFWTYLSLLPPYGAGNPEPVFCAQNLKVKFSNLIGGKHLKMVVTQSNTGRTSNLGPGCPSFEAIGFNLASFYPPPNSLHLAFSPYEEIWQNRRFCKLRIQSLKPIKPN